MNFDLSEEQQLLADSLKRYLANEYSIDARAKIVASSTGWSDTVWAAFAEMGLLGVPFAEEHGGFGGTAVDVMLVMEAIGEGLVVEPYWVNVGLAGRLIARGGSAEQQKRILPPLIQGKRRLAFAHTERTARYDLGHVGARATRSGSSVIVFGSAPVWRTTKLKVPSGWPSAGGWTSTLIWSSFFIGAVVAMRTVRWPPAFSR